MSLLVSRNNSLLRRNSQLVRSPITIRLSPDQTYVYAGAGTYAGAYPRHGFTGVQTKNGCINAGEKLTREYVTPSSIYQGWFNSRNPICAWYQGLYATSGLNEQWCNGGCEAFAQFAAYHFTLPSSVTENKSISPSARMSFVNGGLGTCYYSAAKQDSRNAAIAGDMYLNFAYASSLSECYSINQIKNLPHIQYNQRGAWDFRGYIQLWGWSDGYDGNIPVLSFPPTVTLDLKSNMQNGLIENGGGWIVAHHAVGWDPSSPGGYAPYYSTSTKGKWACASAWGVTIELTID